MSASVDPRRRCLTIPEWPEGHQTAWQAGVKPRGRFSQQSPAAHLAADSVEKYAEGYGRWLGYLSWHGLLDEKALPAARVTRETVAAYIGELIELGNSDYTVVGRLQELVGALKILAPNDDHGWILWPGGVPIRRRFAMRRRGFTIYHPLKLYRWGFRLMKRSQQRTGPQRRRVMLRDGILIALLAARGLRLRSIHALRLGTNMHRRDGRWWIDLDEVDVKTGRPIEFRVPYSLNGWIDRYVQAERVELLRGKAQDAFWIGWDGEPMEEVGIDKRIRWNSGKEFGVKQSFGVHRFRYGISTHGPMEMPHNPGISAGLLAITPEVDGEHYNRGKRFDAAGRFLTGLAKEREETVSIAERHFRGRLDGDAIRPGSQPEDGTP